MVYPSDLDDRVHYDREDHFITEDITYTTLNGAQFLIDGSPAVTKGNVSYVNVNEFSGVNPLAQAIESGISRGLPVAVTSPVTITSTISPSGPFELYGTGPSAIITPSSALFNLFELTVANDGSLIKDLVVNGKATNDSTTQFFISQNGATPSPNRVTVKNIRILPDALDRNVNCGIKVYQATDWLIEGLIVVKLWGSDLSNTGYGVLTGRSKRIMVSDSLFVGDRAGNRGRHAVYLTVATSDCTVSNVTVIEHDRSGIIMKAGPTGESCDRNLIIGCKVLEHGNATTDQAGISIGGAGKYNRISSCVVDNCINTGINIIPGDNSSFVVGVLSDNSIEGCTITNCVGQAIELQSTTRTLITGNRIHNAGTGGSHR